MKKIITLMLIIGTLVLMSLHTMAATNVKDVSPNHWAYQSVLLLIEKGYLPAYEDNTFRGNEPVTRYQLAVAVARILDDISKGNVIASQDDVKLLRELALELREELVAVSTKLKLFENRMVEADRERAVLREDLTEAQDDIITLTSSQQRVIIEVNKIIEELKQYGQDIADLKNDITVISKTLEQSGAQFTENLVVQENLLTSLQEDLSLLKESTKEDDLKLAEQITIVAEALAEKEKALKDEINRINSEKEQLKEELASLKEQHKSDIEAVKKENMILKVLIGVSALISILMN